MPANHYIADRQKLAMHAVSTLHPGLLTNAANPFIGASGCVSCASRPTTFEAASVDIPATAKQLAEQRDLGIGWGMIVERYSGILNRYISQSQQILLALVATAFPLLVAGPFLFPFLFSVPCV